MLSSMELAELCCPFCGDHPYRCVGIDSAGVLTAWVECWNCGATGNPASTIDDAIRAWDEIGRDGDGEVEMVVQTIEEGLCTLAAHFGWDAATSLMLNLSELYDMVDECTVNECPHGYIVDSKYGKLWTLDSNGDREHLLVAVMEEEDND